MTGYYENYVLSEAISVIIMIISQACISMMAAHCVGLINSLWTLNQIKK